MRDLLARADIRCETSEFVPLIAESRVQENVEASHSFRQAARTPALTYGAPSKTAACERFPSALKRSALQLDRPGPQTVIRNDANNRSRHISGYYKQTGGALPGRPWKSGETLEALEGEQLCP